MFQTAAKHADGITDIRSHALTYGSLMIALGFRGAWVISGLKEIKFLSFQLSSTHC
jgi:hypothetical protein